jgi:5-methylcytosine-specific restriction enzyme subunit McrC
MSRDQIARHDYDDFTMVKVAELALDLVLPSETVGGRSATRLERDEQLLRKIFEKAVAGLYRHELHGKDGWNVRSQATLHWPKETATAGLTGLMPSMAADIILQQHQSRRIVLDTKFTNALAQRPYGGESFKSSHIYQLYAYLRSQAGSGDELADQAEGILLYPAIDRSLDECIVMHRHRFRFVTVDLTLPGEHLRSTLLDLVRVPPLS